MERTITDPVTTARPPPGRAGRAVPGPLFAALAGITSLLIFVQGLTAGQFVSQDHRDGWIAVHGVVGNVAVLTALVTAVYAVVALRRCPGLRWGSVALLVLLVLQDLTGQLITHGKLDGLIGVHVPLALLVFGATVWLSVRAALLRRSGGDPED
jgi:heme A synthase